MLVQILTGKELGAAARDPQCKNGICAREESRIGNMMSPNRNMRRNITADENVAAKSNIRPRMT